ncbi:MULTISPECIES: hypothetical protein [Pseudomonas]|uniref:hypothetical protein n=1 Tax=Pseudomonas TaxID=286 RepID=UPI0012FF735B|nr:MULTISPECIES: hypothetical protein [Pseudomonas]
MANKTELPNSEPLLEVASAAREVVLDVESGACPKASVTQLKDLLVRLNLWEDFDPEGE